MEMVEERARDPLLRLHGPRLPRLAVGRHRRTRAAVQVRHGLRGQPRPRRGRGPLAGVGALRRAAGSRGRRPRRRHAAPRRRPVARARASRRRATRTSTRSPSGSSASAGPGCSRRRAARSPPNGGTRASPVPTARGRRQGACPVLDLWLLRPDGRGAAGGLRRVRQRVVARPTPGSSASTTGAARTPRSTSTHRLRSAISPPILDDFELDPA